MPFPIGGNINEVPRRQENRFLTSFPLSENGHLQYLEVKSRIFRREILRDFCPQMTRVCLFCIVSNYFGGSGTRESPPIQAILVNGWVLTKLSQVFIANKESKKCVVIIPTTKFRYIWRRFDLSKKAFSILCEMK